MRRITLLGFPLLSGSMEETAVYIASLYEKEANLAHIVCHINANNFERIVDNQVLLNRLSMESHMMLDGIALKLASAWYGHGWVPDVNGTDLFPLVMARLKAYKPSLFLVGSKEGVVSRTAAEIERTLGISVVGHKCGYFGKDAEREICDEINRSGAQVLLVGRGCPLQENYVLRNRHALNVRLIWVVGGLFDFLAGVHPRAPLLFRQARLEWLFRWVIEPRQKAFRTWVLYPRFLARVAWRKLAQL